MLCALCFVLCALCFVLCALCLVYGCVLGLWLGFDDVDPVPYISSTRLHKPRSSPGRPAALHPPAPTPPPLPRREAAERLERGALDRAPRRRHDQVPPPRGLPGGAHRQQRGEALRAGEAQDLCVRGGGSVFAGGLGVGFGRFVTAWAHVRVFVRGRGFGQRAPGQPPQVIRVWKRPPHTRTPRPAASSPRAPVQWRPPRRSATPPARATRARCRPCRWPPAAAGGRGWSRTRPPRERRCRGGGRRTCLERFWKKEWFRA